MKELDDTRALDIEARALAIESLLIEVIRAIPAAQRQGLFQQARVRMLQQAAARPVSTETLARIQRAAQ